MNCPIHASSPSQAWARGIYDGIDCLCGDVSLNYLNHAGSNSLSFATRERPLLPIGVRPN
jgi:hypothetical protein